MNLLIKLNTTFHQFYDTIDEPVRIAIFAATVIFILIGFPMFWKFVGIILLFISRYDYLRRESQRPNA